MRGYEQPRLEIVAAERAVRLSGERRAGWWLRRLDEPFRAGRASWEWRVLEQPAGADLRERGADDSALRVFVVFGAVDPSADDARAIFYTWGHTEPNGFRSDSHRSRRLHVIRLAGSDHVGESWRAEEVDPFRDYRRVFGEEPPAISAVGFMQDTDQTRRPAVSELRALRLQPVHR